MSTPQIPWLRVLVEGAVIVGSILLALTADAWWDGVTERALERDALDRLSAEFVEVDSVLANWQANHQSVVDAAFCGTPVRTPFHSLLTVSASCFGRPLLPGPSIHLPPHCPLSSRLDAWI
jgi:hypothetical protein